MPKYLGRSSSKLKYYFHTLRYLKFKQIYAQFYTRFYYPKLPRTESPKKRQIAYPLVLGRAKPQSLIGEDNFYILNKSYRLEHRENWNDPRQDKLLLYNIHYFDDLNSDGAKQRFEWHLRLIQRWIDENPPTMGNGWEPYPISLRAVNWIKWDILHSALNQSATESLALQLRWLRRRLEYHLLGNHLIANAKALVFGGLYFKGEEADDWLQTGLQLLHRELAEQILHDGGHFERSPMYHFLVLEDVLDLINICRAYDQHVPHEWSEKASQMLHWASVMRHPDGDIPFFNDAAFGIAGRFDELQAYADRLGIDTPSKLDVSAWLKSTGYLRLMNRDAVLFFDAGPVGPDYLPGHAHADTLSLELSLFGRRVLVNSGTSVYGTGPERQRQRGTNAHNTVMVDGQDSSEVWGGFRVARRARIRSVSCALEDGLAVAEHDGYRRLPGRPMHRRQIQLTDRALVVVDTVTGAHHHNVQGAWHLHPNVHIACIKDGPDAGVQLRVPVGNEVREAALTVQGPVTLAVEECTWHPEFGRTVPNKRVVFRYDGLLPVTVVTRLQW